MFLSFTRGLFPATKAPHRDPDLFDTFDWVDLICDAPAGWDPNVFDSFNWVRTKRDIPTGCVVFTDGSLLDGLLPDGWKSLGWAFAIVSQAGVVVAAAKGVPPRWVDSIQGAELWAAMMALQHAPLPELLLTDCDAVRLGTRKDGAWASSSRRRYARVWTVLHHQLEDNKESVQWLPAHTAQSAIGQKLCSDGKPINELRWFGNQIVDLLAQQAADEIRIGSAERAKLRSLEQKLLELVLFLGRLTYQVNHFQLPDGSFIRDSEGSSKYRKPRPRVRKRTIPSKVVCAPSEKGAKRFNPDDWVDAWRQAHSCSKVVKQTGNSKSARAKRAEQLISQRQEAAFQEWWRESRNQSMQPRASTASASARMDALGQRVLAKAAANTA